MFAKFVGENYDVTKLEDLSPRHIKMYVSSLQERDCKPSYINDLLKAVRVMCNYAYREEYTSYLLTKSIRNVKQPKVLIHTFSDQEIKRLIKYYDGKDYISLRNKVIIMILFDTGIRISELLNMRPNQIQENYFVIYGKGRKERVVPKNPMVSKWLMKYLAARSKYFELRDCQEYVFLSKNGKQLTSNAVDVFLKKAARDVGVNPVVRVSPHTFRHTFAHQQLKNGLDLYSLSRLLGHESVSITQRYLEAIRDSQVLTSARHTSVLSNL
jgi:integrase/recombinase XerD